MATMAVRGYTRKSSEKGRGRPPYFPDHRLRHSRVLVFDTETTTDWYQNFKIGYFQIYQDGIFQHHGLIHTETALDEREVKTLRRYAQRNTIPLYRLDEFIDEVFYPEVFDLKTLCVGFNLPFDLSRIARRAAPSRGRNRGGFTLALSEDQSQPPIIVKQLGSAYSIKCSSTRKNMGKDYFTGYFLDAQTLAEVLLQSKRVSLQRAGEMLNITHAKYSGVTHGRVTEKYIEYNIRDVEATYEVYHRLVKELDLFQIDIPLTKVFSSASIGKYALQQMGVTPFRQQNPDFSDTTLGAVMSAYYGGRTECRIRKQPTKVTVLDFTSMYPTITLILDLWPYLIADKVVTEDATATTREFLTSLALGDLQNPHLWKTFVVLVKVRPDEDVLPVRMDYKGDNSPFVVGLNRLSSSKGMWYALPDVIASVLLTGKVPQILEAIRFVPVGQQASLQKTQIHGVDIDPRRDNLFQVLVEKRQEIKQRLKALPGDDPERLHLSSQAQAIKILVNAMSYGIFIELNPEDTKSLIEVFGLDMFSTEENRHEREGKYFHPLLSVMITAGSRLFLAMAEAKVLELGGRHAYMDTDSIFVPPHLAQPIVDFFQPLNPYNLDISLLKPEKENMWFYGISSKRYALYYLDGEEIRFMDGERSYKLHGLGHLTNPFPNNVSDWQAEVWLDILRLHYGFVSVTEIEEKYAHLYAVARLSVSTAHVWKRFEGFNKEKSWNEQIKPFNFYLVGFKMQTENGAPVKPISPLSKDPQTIVHREFIDYQTGEVKRGSHYFKPLSQTILEYASHPEYKFAGNVGLLERRHLVVDDIVHIGKEANNIDDQALDIRKAQMFRDKNTECQKILAIRQCDAEKVGVDRKTFQRIKARIQKNGTINIKTRAVRRLLTMC